MTAQKLARVIALAAAAMLPAAHAIDAVVSPSSTSAAVDATALVNLTTPGAVDGFDQNTPLLEVLDRRNIPLRSVLAPASFALSWNPVFEGIVTSYTSTSSQGVLRLDGEQVGVRNQTLSSFCINPNCALASETLTLAPAVGEDIARTLLQGITLGEAARGIGNRSATLSYTRAFSHAGTSPDDHVATVNIALSLRPNVNVSLAAFRLLSVEGRSGSLSLPAATTAQVPVNLSWEVRYEQLGAPPPVTLRSDAVEVLDANGRLLQRIPRPLTRALARGRSLAEAFPGAGAATGSEQFNDVLTLPPSVAAAAARAGTSRIVLRRTFTDGSTTRSADIPLVVGSTSMAAFQVTRVDLRFEDGARAAVVDRNLPLHAVADINYLGSGQLQATWEWAPVSGGGAPLFRPLPPSTPLVASAPPTDFDTRYSRTLVREFLNNRQRIRLVSPVLPTTETGGVLLRLTIGAPDVAFQLPVIRYYVGGDGAPPVLDTAGLAPLSLLAPTGNADVRRDTLFRWLPVAGATAYRMECYDDLMMSAGMRTGQVVPLERAQLAVSALVMEHLEEGAGYWCRVVAIGGGGLPSAASELVRLTARR